MIKEVEDCIIKNYSELRTFCKRLTKHNDWSEDLLHEVIIQLYEKKEIKIKVLDNKSIKNYIFKCIITNWFSETSPFYRKVRRESTLYNELSTLPSQAPQFYTDSEIEELHKMMSIVEMEFEDLNWFSKIIFTKYMLLGSLKKVATDTTIPLTSIARYVKETKATVKYNTIIRFNKED